MDEESYKEQFEALTGGMAIEKVYDQLAERADVIRFLTAHCGEIYKSARKAGLNRKTSRYMAREYFRSEMSSGSNYYPGEG